MARTQGRNAGRKFADASIPSYRACSPLRLVCTSWSWQATRVLVALVSMCQQNAIPAEPARPFTVADSIAMTRLVDPDPTLTQIRVPRFKVAPDGSSFIAVARSGNLTTGSNEYRLCLFDAAEVRHFVNEPTNSRLPHADVVATFATSSHRHGIDEVRWLNNGAAIAFIGRDARQVGQVYLLDVKRRVLQRLTDHTADVATFDLHPAKKLLIYTAYQIPDWTVRNAHGYAVQSHAIEELTTTNPAQLSVRASKHFIKRLDAAGPPIEVDIEAAAIPSVVVLSPNARYAVALRSVRVLPHWLDYPVFGDSPESLRTLGSDAFGRPSTWLWQYVLVDTSTGIARPLLDAPAAMSGSMTMINWSSDSTSVVVAPTFLPTHARRGDARRRTSQVVAEVHIANGSIAQVAELTPPSSHDGRRVFLTALYRRRDGTLAVHEREHEGDDLAPRYYRKQQGRWVRVRVPSPPADGLELAIVQDMNTAPEIVATDLRTRHSRTITTLNPNLSAIHLGRMEVFRWTDRYGHEFTGGLLLPPDFRANVRYPVVLQTYGFRPDEFLVDGPNGMATAFAARALAGRGFVVLQMPQFGTSRQSPTVRDEIPDLQSENTRFLAMMEAAIDALDARGVIDRHRVGLIGFSRTGMHVHYAITFSRYPIAAATIADAIAATPLSYALVYGAAPPGMLQWEHPDLIGAHFWGEGVARWLERSPIYHLHRVRTPLRYEHLGTTVPAYWDTFAILKRHRRPVEMIHIPLASHRLETPFARHTSQQGNVDWFAFWLKGEEDSDPAKADQYRRWRLLLKDQERIENASVPGGPCDSGVC